VQREREREREREGPVCMRADSADGWCVALGVVLGVAGGVVAVQRHAPVQWGFSRARHLRVAEGTLWPEEEEERLRGMKDEGGEESSRKHIRRRGTVLNPPRRCG